MENESHIQMSIHELLSRVSVMHFCPLNEVAMMMLKMFKVPKQTSYKILAYLKKMGLSPGIPDVIILQNGVTYFLELKTTKGRLSIVQSKIHSRLESQGFIIATVYGFDEAYQKLREWELI